jgi:hypothetical protein
MGDVSSSQAPIRWARRVEQHKIRQLYARDAQGIVDEELVDEVGYAMYARCESIATVTVASQGRAKCHACGEIIRHRGVKDAPMICVCGWQTTWGEYLASYQRKQLHGGNAFPAFEKFVERWPEARNPRDKLLEIDRLIHELHLNAEVERFARPAGVNVIEGSMKTVIALLNELAYSDLSTPGLDDARATWKGRLDTASDAMREHLESRAKE